MEDQKTLREDNEKFQAWYMENFNKIIELVTPAYHTITQQPDQEPTESSTPNTTINTTNNTNPVVLASHYIDRPDLRSKCPLLKHDFSTDEATQFLQYHQRHIQASSPNNWQEHLVSELIFKFSEQFRRSTDHIQWQK